MHSTFFEHLARVILVSRSRREMAGVLGLVAIATPGLTQARTKRWQTCTRITRNAFGCVNVGNSCRNSGSCCSGICQNT